MHEHKHKQQQSNRSNDSAIVCFFVDLLNCCYFLFNYCLLLRKSLTLGGCPGALGPAHRDLFHFSGVPFFTLFSCTHFFDKKRHLSPTGHPKWLPNSSQTWLWTYFVWFSAHTVFAALRSVFDRFHCSHLFKNTQKLNKNKVLKTPWKNMMIS